MIKRDNVYAQAEEKFVKTLMVYADSSNVLFYDAELKNAVSTVDLKDLFLKGLTVVTDDACLKAVAYTEAGITCYDGTAAVEFTATEPATV